MKTLILCLMTLFTTQMALAQNSAETPCQAQASEAAKDYLKHAYPGHNGSSIFDIDKIVFDGESHFIFNGLHTRYSYTICVQDAFSRKRAFEITLSRKCVVKDENRDGEFSDCTQALP